MSGPEIFFARLREMTERFDPRYVAFRRRTADFRYPMVRLSELLSALPEYGASEAGIERTSIKQPQSLLHLKRFREVAAHNFTGTSGHQRVTADFFKTIKHPDSAALRARPHRIHGIIHSHRSPQVESRRNRRARRGEEDDRVENH